MPAALLRPLTVRKLVELLRPLPARERATILAQSVHEGTMTRVGADQILIALALDGNGLSARRHAQHYALSRRQAQRNVILGNPHDPKPFTAEARQQWLPADVSGRRSARTRARGTDTPRRGLVAMPPERTRYAQFEFFDPDPLQTYPVSSQRASSLELMRTGRGSKVWTIHQIGPAIGFCSPCLPAILSGLCRSLNTFAANASRS